MSDKLRARLDHLREEYTAGMNAMAELQKKQEELRATLLRISGAIQVLEELLAGEEPTAPVTPSLPKAN